MAKTIENGSFRDPLGNALDGGRLELFLSQEAHEKVGGQIAPTKVSITLNSTGDVAGTLILANDELDPDGTFYRATAYDADGARVYGPVDWVLSGASPIDLDDIIPTSVAVSAISPVPSTRLISTTAPLTGGGDLSIDRTHVLTGAPSTRGDIYSRDASNAASLPIGGQTGLMIMRGTTEPTLMLWANRRNRAATAAPTTGDDATLGYNQSSLWIDITNDNAYICVDEAVGAAVWKRIDPIAVYALQAQTISVHSPADSTDYFFGAIAGAPSTTADLARVYFPKAGNITGWRLFVIVNGTLGSSETVDFWVRTNDTTDNLNIQVALDAQKVAGSASGTIAVSAGDYFEIKFTTPGWVTNPLNVQYGAVVLVEDT